MSGSFADGDLGGLRAIIGPRPGLMPGARVIAEDGQGRVLLIRRGDTTPWGWPAGPAEIGQSIEDTARQELVEETGLTAHRPVPIGFSRHPCYDRIEYPPGGVRHTFPLDFHCPQCSGTLPPSARVGLD